MEEKNKKYKILIIIVMIIAILLRLVFILKTDISTYQYDAGMKELYTEQDYENLYENFDKGKNEGRHINYIMHIYKYNSLPNEIKGQFYHPPLHHCIMAGWLKFVDIFPLSSTLKIESMQFVTFIYSIVALVAFYKILKEINLNDKSKLIALTLFAFYPLNIFLAGSINNDMLLMMFCIVSLLYIIKWQKNPTMKSAIIIALCIGLGSMTKTSMALMLAPAIYVYFRVLNQYVKNDKKIVNLLIQLVLFAIIVLILGLWYQIMSLLEGRNVLGIIAPFEYLSIANRSIWERFGITNLFYMNDYNIWNFLIYTSLNFGIILENSFYIRIMIILVLILILDSIYFMCKNKRENIIFIITNIVWWIGYFYLNISMPYICSMCARYMFMPLAISIIFIGIGMEKETNKFMKIQTTIATVIFSMISIIGFILL